MLRAVLDAGVLVAAAITPNGLCGQLLKAVLDGRYVMVVCPLLLAELEEVLRRPKFQGYLSIEQAHVYASLVARIAENRPDPPIRVGVTPDPDDDYLVALAQTAEADYLISGDRHLTELSGVTPPVLTPRAFMDYVNDAKERS